MAFQRSLATGMLCALVLVASGAATMIDGFDIDTIRSSVRVEYGFEDNTCLGSPSSTRLFAAACVNTGNMSVRTGCTGSPTAINETVSIIYNEQDCAGGIYRVTAEGFPGPATTQCFASSSLEDDDDDDDYDDDDDESPYKVVTCIQPDTMYNQVYSDADIFVFSYASDDCSGLYSFGVDAPIESCKDGMKGQCSADDEFVEIVACSDDDYDDGEAEEEEEMAEGGMMHTYEEEEEEDEDDGFTVGLMIPTETCIVDPIGNFTGIFDGDDDLSQTEEWFCGSQLGNIGLDLQPSSAFFTAAPSAAPTPYPTAAPTPYPTATPTAYPTATPTASPTATAAPTMAPTVSVAPSASPTSAPTPGTFVEVEVSSSLTLDGITAETFNDSLRMPFAETVASLYSGVSPEDVTYGGFTDTMRRLRTVAVREAQQPQRRRLQTGVDVEFNFAVSSFSLGFDDDNLDTQAAAAAAEAEALLTDAVTDGSFGTTLQTEADEAGAGVTVTVDQGSLTVDTTTTAVTPSPTASPTATPTPSPTMSPTAADGGGGGGGGGDEDDDLVVAITVPIVVVATIAIGVAAFFFYRSRADAADGNVVVRSHLNKNSEDIEPEARRTTLDKEKEAMAPDIQERL